ncbi:MAG: hypothetical protein QM784_40650 [Polyangiaceae bacterium]
MSSTGTARRRAAALLSLLAIVALSCHGATSPNGAAPQVPKDAARRGASATAPTSSHPGTTNSKDASVARAAVKAATVAPELQHPSIDAPFGADTAVSVGPVAPRGEWTVLCSAPTKSAPTATLHGAAGQTMPLDGWLGSSADGRFVAFTQKERWLLVDTYGWRVTNLGERGLDRRLSRSSLPIGSLHFHPSQSRLAFVTSDPSGARVVVLDLDTLEESTFAAPSEAVERLRWDPSGKALLLEDDPNPPKAASSQSTSARATPLTLPSPCAVREPFLFVDTSRQRPRRTTLLRVEDRQSSLGTGHLLALDVGAFAWTTDKDLVLRRGGTETRLLPPTCPSTVLGVHPGTETVLVGCAERGRLHLNLVSVARQQTLSIDIPQVYDLFDRVITTRLLPIYSGSKILPRRFRAEQGVALDRSRSIARTIRR